jgi:hypothetical protein
LVPFVALVVAVHVGELTVWISACPNAATTSSSGCVVDALVTDGLALFALVDPVLSRGLLVTTPVK